MRTSIIMVSFYLLLLIPLISALRRVDEPDQFNVLRGNKPILRMAVNADDSVLRSGSLRPHKKHHLNKKQHQLRNKKAILGEDSAHVVRNNDEDDSRGKSFFVFHKTKITESSKSSSTSEESQSKGTSKSSKTYSDSPGFIKSIFEWTESLQGKESQSKETSKSSKTYYESPGFIKSIFEWIERLQGNNSFSKIVTKDHVLNLNLNSNKRIRHSNSRHVNVTTTTERPYVTYVHQEDGGVFEKLWFLFVGDSDFPKHIFGRSGRPLQVYEGFKKDGKLVLRKANKDIDLSKLEDGNLVLRKANKDIDLSELNPDIMYSQ